MLTLSSFPVIPSLATVVLGVSLAFSFSLFLSFSPATKQRKRMKRLGGRPESEEAVEVAAKRPRAAELTEADDEDEEMMMLAGFSVEEETLMQVMKLLEEEINRPPANNPNANPCSAISSPASSSSSSSSSSFVTINGYEESCGPSFSDSSSTVMASFDMGSVFVGPTKGGFGFHFPATSGSGSGTPDLPPPSSAVEELEWPEIGEVSVLPGISEKGKGRKNECGESESDEDWLARVLNGAPFDFVE